MTELSLAKAINMGLQAAMAADDHVVLLGEDIGRLGGVFRVTDGLQAEFGDDRVIDTPVAESGIVGTAIGLAHAGFRPVVEIQFDGFVYPAYDQIVTQLARHYNRSAGHLPMPVVRALYQALELRGVAAEAVAAHRDLLAGPHQHLLAHHPAQVVERLPEGAPRLFVAQLRPEEGEQDVAPHGRALRHERQVGEQGEALGLRRGGSGVVPRSFALEADAAERLELDHGLAV
jgi:hypothetical protein